MEHSEKSLEHARAVHFYLVGYCIILLTSLVVLSNGVATKALEDLRGILQLQAAIEANPEILHVLAENRFREGIVDLSASAPTNDEYIEVLFEYLEQPEKVVVKLRPPRFLISDLVEYPFQVFPEFRYSHIATDERVSIGAPKTLGEFREFWTEFQNPRRIFFFPQNQSLEELESQVNVKLFTLTDPDNDSFEPLPEFFDDPIRRRLTIGSFPKSVQRMTAVVRSIDAMSVDSAFPLLLQHLTSDDAAPAKNGQPMDRLRVSNARTFFVVLQDNLYWEVMQGLSRDELRSLKLDLRRENPLFRGSEEQWTRAAFLNQQAGDVLIEVTRRTEEIDIEYQRYFARFVGQDWEVGSFAFSFPELDSLYGTTVDDLRLQDLLEVVSQELERSGGAVEVFGLSIPAQIIYNWGGSILVLIQVYFTLHLRNIVSVGYSSNAYGFPWVGSFLDVASRIVFAFTAAGLPIAVAGLTAYSRLSAWSVVVLFLVGVVAIITLVQHRKFLVGFRDETSR